jgi:hypothetical protein
LRNVDHTVIYDAIPFIIINYILLNAARAAVDGLKKKKIRKSRRIYQNVNYTPSPLTVKNISVRSTLVPWPADGSLKISAVDQYENICVCVCMYKIYMYIIYMCTYRIYERIYASIFLCACFHLFLSHRVCSVTDFSFLCFLTSRHPSHAKVTLDLHSRFDHNVYGIPCDVFVTSDIMHTCARFDRNLCFPELSLRRNTSGKGSRMGFETSESRFYV